MLNKVTLIGNLGADPEIRQMPNGGSVANITVATTFRWKDKQSGERKESTEWHRVVFFNRLAEIVGEYLHKGSQVYLEGRLQTRMYEKEGAKHYTTEIVATEMNMLGGKREGGNTPQSTQSGQGTQPRPQNSSRPASMEDFDDDIPF